MCFFFNDTATTEIYPLSLHDALPISPRSAHPGRRTAARAGPGGPGQERSTRMVERLVEPAVSIRGLYKRDRKSTRLNSSHANISYAVFCLKKKKNHSYLTSRTA